MKVGFFDSGIGGITVLNTAIKMIPEADYIYYADTENVPYGTKSKKEVKSYVFKAVEFLIDCEIDALVIACNTATSIAVKALRSKYSVPIIGMEPAVKPAVERVKQKKVLVTATPLTIKEDKFHNLVKTIGATGIVDALALPKLVDFAEDFIFSKNIINSYLKEKLADYNLKEYGTLVLGCTHFSFYKSFFKELLPNNIEVIDGNYGTVRHLKNRLIEREIIVNKQRKGKGELTFYSNREKKNKILKKYLRILDKYNV